MATASWETEFRRQRFQQLTTAYERSDEWGAEEEAERYRAAERPAATAFLSAFSETGDLEELRRSLDSWSKTGGSYFGFKGPNGQMYLNQLPKDGQAAGIAARLA